MPYTSKHKLETRNRIVTSARKLFNRRGFTEVSIDEIMGDAGLTRGGFYNHFKTKDELYAEAVTIALACHTNESPNDHGVDFEANPVDLARQIVSAYLSDGHFTDIDSSCPLIALPSDVARGGEKVKDAYQQVLNAMLSLFQESQKGHADARQRALTIATLCIGGMVLARAVDDDAFSAEIRDAAMTRALEAGGWDPAAQSVAAE